MATKDDCLSFKKRQIGFVDSGDQYSNLNLNNQNHDYVFEEIFRPKIIAFDNKKSQNYDLSHSKDLRSETNSWNKFNKRSSTTFLNLNNDFEARNEFKKAKSANNSTLSLHIAAYENSTEVPANSHNRERADERKWKNPKHSFTRSNDVIENLFEFPRQQENEKNKTPEVAQFKASQKLLNPNKSETDSLINDENLCPDIDLSKNISSDATANLKSPKLPKGESEIGLATNCFKLQKLDVQIYHYIVQFTKMLIDSDKETPLFEGEDERMLNVLTFHLQKINRQLMEIFFEYFPDIFPGGSSEHCYNGSTSLYSFSSILVTSKSLKLPTFKCEKIMNQKCLILLNIQPSQCPIIDLKDINDKGNGKEVEQFLKTVVLNSAVLRQENSPYFDTEKLFCYDTLQITKTGFPIFAKFQKLHIGVVPNIVCIEDSPALVLDTIRDIFYPPINLHKLCCYYFGIRKNDDLYPDENYQLNSFLNGLICFSKFGENINFPCILNGHEHSHADTVRIEHNNVEMSLKKFYRTVYNYDIKRLYWPLAVTIFNGKKHFYPLECLTVAPGQKGKLSNIDLLKIPLLHQFLTASNDTKLEEIESASAIFQTSKNEICKSLKISFENSPLSVKAKHFSPPEIVYENASITPNSNGQWKIQTYDLKYIDGSTCENWRAVLLQSSNYSLTSVNFEKFILCYCIYANCHGLMMKMEVPSGRFYKRRSDNPKFPVISIEATKEQIDKIFEEANQQFRKFLLFGYDVTEVKLCSYIKWMGRKFNIITQFISIPHILEAIYNETPIIGEIIAKTNIKLGGLNYNIEIPNYDKNALFIGIHVEMPSDNLSSDNEISKFATIGFCANDDVESYFKQSGNFFVQSLKEDKIEEVISKIITEIIERLEEIPYFSHVIIYRSGGGGSENECESLIKEASVIQKTLSDYSLNAPLTFIVSKPEKYIKFFAINKDPLQHNEDILVGTVIDSSVTHPSTNEFFLRCSSNSTCDYQFLKFSIIYSNDNSATLSMLERWTYEFCYNNQVDTSVLDKPSLLSTAEKYAKNGRELLEMFFETGGSFNFFEDVEIRSSKVNYSNNSCLRGKNIVA